MKPGFPKWVWLAGLAIIILIGVLFVLEGVQETPTHGRIESTVLVVGLTTGAGLVTWYWGARWMRLRHNITPGNSLLRRIGLRYRIFIGIALLALIALGVQEIRMSSNPALMESESFVRGNEAVLAVYGPINGLTVDAMFWKVETAPDGTSTGKYTFDLTGAKKTGVVQVTWLSDHGAYTATEIDELPDGDTGRPQKLWRFK